MAAAEPLTDSQIVIQRPDAEIAELRPAVDADVAQARALVVDSDAAFERAAEFLKRVKGIQKQMIEILAPHIQRANDAHKGLTQLRKEQIAPLEEAESLVKRKMGDFIEAEERRAREEERRRQEEARKQEEERRLQEAAEAEARGDTAEAEAIVDAPIVPPPAAPAPAKPKAEGVSTVKRYSAEVVDLAELVKAAAQNEHLLQYLLPNEKALNALARSVGESMNVPGVRVKATTTVSARGR
ncbi:MAG: hypothetical protein NXI30_04370 [bacterium]|nr:hypothetical protein [bacterium]